jgi:hypothetical protein
VLKIEPPLLLTVKYCCEGGSKIQGRGRGRRGEAGARGEGEGGGEGQRAGGCPGAPSLRGSPPSDTPGSFQPIEISFIKRDVSYKEVAQTGGAGEAAGAIGGAHRGLRTLPHAGTNGNGLLTPTQGAPKKKKFESDVYLISGRWPLNGVGRYLFFYLLIFDFFMAFFVRFSTRGVQKHH